MKVKIANNPEHIVKEIKNCCDIFLTHAQTILWKLPLGVIGEAACLLINGDVWIVLALWLDKIFLQLLVLLNIHTFFTLQIQKQNKKNSLNIF